jgi:hypothetical protein
MVDDVVMGFEDAVRQPVVAQEHEDQIALITIAHLGYCAETVVAVGGVLAWHPAEEGRKLATGLEDRGIRYAVLIDNGIEWSPPIRVRIIHHDIHENGHQKAQDGGTVTDLVAIDCAVPGGAPVNELITQHIQPIEQEAQNACAVLVSQILSETPR